MTNFAETSPEFTQLDQRLNKVFSGYLGVKKVVRYSAIGLGLGYLSIYLLLLHLPAWVITLTQWISPVAGVTIFVSYFVGLALTIKHGDLVSKYRRAIESHGGEPTGMYLRAVDGFKRARRQAIILGLALVSPFALIGTFIYALMKAKGGLH